jgi:hypothetical protein
MIAIITAIMAIVTQNPIDNLVSAVQARKQFGELLDEAFYLNKSFVVERSGEPRAALVPLQVYSELKQLKKQARLRFMKTTKTMRKAFSSLEQKEQKKLVKEALAYSSSKES